MEILLPLESFLKVGNISIFWIEKSLFRHNIQFFFQIRRIKKILRIFLLPDNAQFGFPLEEYLTQNSEKNKISIICFKIIFHGKI